MFAILSRSSALVATGCALATLFACSVEQESIKAVPCSPADIAEVDAEIQNVFDLLLDDGTAVENQVGHACEPLVGQEEECTRTLFTEECEIHIFGVGATTPEEEALQDECVPLAEELLALGCEL